MSTTIDERVVEMRFDNKHFEDNVKTSLSTLDKLKQKLNLTGAAKGLENVGAAAKNVNLTPISGAVETVRTKFSALEVMAVTALANITNSAVNAGKRIVSSLTIDPVKMGFSEYETQINAIQTILANTSSKGTTLEDVNSALDELNTYADKTIYNFTEMTRNIGTFTAAGVDLETSVAAIKGIANLAAVSGSTSQQASTAMYQLSQALAAGTVKLMDWNSVVNAGMGGQVFQDALKETARVHGVAIDQMIEDEGSFRETLKNGWITAEVLTETLSKFTGDLNKEQLKTMGYTEDQIEGILKMGQTANDAATKVKTFTQLLDTLKEAAQSGWTQTWEIIVGDFGEAKELFTEISDVVGGIIGKSAEARNNLLEGAMGSKWKQLEKQVTNTGISFDDFQEKLKATAKSHGISIDEMIEKEGSLEKTLKSGWLTSDIISETLHSYTDGISDAADVTSDITAKLSEFQDVIDQVIKGDFGNGEERLKKLTDAGYDYATIQGLVNYVMSDGTAYTWALANGTDELSDAQLKNIGYTDEQIAAIKELAEQAEKAGTPLNELIASMEKPSGRELLIDTFRNVLTALGNVINSVKKAWTEIFPPMTSKQLYGIIEALHSLSEKLVVGEESADKLRRTFKGLFAILDIVTTITGGAFKIALKVLCQILGIADINVLDLTSSVGDAVVSFRDWLFESNAVARGLSKIGEVVVKAAKKIKAWIDEFMALPEVQANIEKFKAGFTVMLTNFKKLLSNGIKLAKQFGQRLVDGAKKIKAWIDEFMALPEVQANIDSFKKSASTMLSNIKTALSGCGKSVKEFIENIKSMDSITLEGLLNALKELKNKIVGHFSGIGGSFDNIKNAINGFKENVKSSFGEAGESVSNFASKIFNFFKMIKDKISGKIGIGEILAVALGVGTIKSVKKIGNALETLSAPLNGFTSVLFNISGALRSLDSVLKAKKLDLQASALIKLALAIAILAGAVAVLTLLDQGKLWSSVGAIAVLAGVLLALSIVLNKVNSTLTAGTKSAISLLAIASAVLILVIALKQMDSLDGDKILRNIGILAILMGSLVGFSILLAKLAPRLSKGSLSLIMFAIASKVMVGALEAVTKIADSNNIEKSLLILIGAMGGLALVAAACKNVKIGAALTVIAIAIALKVLINAFDDIAALDTSKMLSNIGAFITIFGMFAVLMAASHLAGKNAAKAGAGIIMMSLALVLIIQVVKQLAGIDQSSLTASLTTVSIVMLLFAGIIAVSALAGNNAAKAGAMLLMMAGAITILAVVIAILSRLDPDGLTRAVVAIAALSACFAVLIGITALAKNCTATLIALTIAIGILAVALGALSMINSDSLTTATIAISTVIGMFALLVASTKLASKASLTLILMTAVVAVLAGILYVLAGLPVESTLGIAASLSVLLLALSASCVILSVAGAAAGPALVGIGVLAAVIVAVGALMVAIGALVELCPGIEEWLDRAIPVLEKIGYGIGAFVGSIVGGLSAGVMSGLPSIAESLSTFMSKLQPFLDGARAIDSEMVEGVASLVGVILMLTAANLIDGIASWLTGGSSIDKFAMQLPILGLGIAAFSATVKGKVDTDAVQTAANAGKLLTELANTVPNSGGLVGFITGENDIGTFAAQLPVLGKALVDFSTTVKGKVDEEAVKTAANAGKILTELADTVPNTGGLLGFITGNNDIGVFAAQLPILGRAIVDFSSTVKGNVDVDAVDTAANAGKILTELADTVPNTGGLLGFITGNNDIGAFAAQLPILGRAIVDFSQVVAGNVDEEAIATAANAGEILTELADTVPNTGGLFGFIVGNNDISAFAVQLPFLARAITDFSQVVTGNVDEDAVATATNAGKLLTELSSNISESKTGGLLSFVVGGNTTTFAAQLPVLAAGIVAFSDTVKDKVDVDAVDTAANAGKLLVSLDNSIPASNAVIDFFTGESNKMNKFADQLPILGEGIVEFSNIVSGQVNTEDVRTATNAGSMLAQVAAKLTHTQTLVDFIANGNFTTFATQLPDLGEGIAKFSANIKDKVDTDAVKTAIDAGTIISDLAARLSDTRSLVDFIAKASIAVFATQLPILGDGIVDFSSIVKGNVDEEAVKTAANAGETIKKLADNISESKTGGLFSFIGNSSNPIKTFADQLPYLGNGIAEFSTNVKDKVDTDAIQTAANAGETLKKLADNISESKIGGLFSFIGNSSDPVTTFADRLPILGGAIADFSAQVKGKVDADAVQTAANAGDILTKLSANIPDSNAFLDFFNGGDKITKFKQQLPILGEGIVAFSNAVSGKIDADDVTAASKVGEVLTTLSKYVTDDLATAMSRFSERLPDLGSAITNYYDKVSTMDVAKLSTAMRQVDDLVRMAKSMVGLDTTGMTKFGSALKTLGTNGVKEFIGAFTNANAKVKNTAKVMLTSFANAARSKRSDVTTAFSDVASYVTNTLRGKYSNFKSAGQYLVEGFASGISENTYKAAAKARAMAAAAVRAAEDELDIASPSKVFYGIGRFTGMGFINALSDYSDKSYDAGSNIAESARTGLTNAISKITDVINGDIDTQPTIRPVLDLSDVESNAGELNALFSRTQAMKISTSMSHKSDEEIQNDGVATKTGNTYQFTQNNYSPKALSRVEIYRQTKNQFSAMERMVKT